MKNSPGKLNDSSREQPAEAAQVLLHEVQAAARRREVDPVGRGTRRRASRPPRRRRPGRRTAGRWRRWRWPARPGGGSRRSTRVSRTAPARCSGPGRCGRSRPRGSSSRFRRPRRSGPRSRSTRSPRPRRGARAPAARRRSCWQVPCGPRTSVPRRLPGSAVGGPTVAAHRRRSGAVTARYARPP